MTLNPADGIYRNSGIEEFGSIERGLSTGRKTTREAGEPTFLAPALDGAPVDKYSASNHRTEVKFSPPFRRCESCGRRTGWQIRESWGEIQAQWHRLCQYCATNKPQYAPYAKMMSDIVALNTHSVTVGIES